MNVRHCAVWRHWKPSRVKPLLNRAHMPDITTNGPLLPSKDPTKSVDEIILLMRDITLRKETEHKLMRADRMATIGFLAAGIAPRNQQPAGLHCRFCRGFAQAFKTRFHISLDDKMFRSFQEYLEIIQSEAYRCKDIIQNLQEFSRSSSNKFEIIPVDRIIRDTMSPFSAACQRFGYCHRLQKSSLQRFAHCFRKRIPIEAPFFEPLQQGLQHHGKRWHAISCFQQSG